MTTLATTHPTLLDLAKSLDPNGNIAEVAEILNETNEVLDDMPWVEANQATGHRGTIRTGLPDPAFRKLYGYTQPTKSTKAQVTDSIGMLDDYAEVDKALVDMFGNPMAFRASEDAAIHIARLCGGRRLVEDRELAEERGTRRLRRLRPEGSNDP